MDLFLNPPNVTAIASDLYRNYRGARQRREKQSKLGNPEPQVSLTRQTTYRGVQPIGQGAKGAEPAAEVELG